MSGDDTPQREGVWRRNPPAMGQKQGYRFRLQSPLWWIQNPNGGYPPYQA